MLPLIKGFVQNSLIDWPGRISSIIFLPGCNFRCPFCHAGHLVVRPNELESIPFESVRAFLRRRRDWIDGVVISGGEPTISEGLPALVEALAELGLPVKLDTNGSRPEVLEDLVAGGTVRAVSMDIKAPLDERYSVLAGTEADLDAIRRSIELILSGAFDEYEFRTTVPPGYLDGDAIEQIARTIEGTETYVLQNFRPVDCIDAGMLGLKPLPVETLKGFAERARPFVERCIVRGHEEIPARPGDA